MNCLALLIAGCFSPASPTAGGTATLDYRSLLLGANPIQAMVNAQIDPGSRRVTVVGDDFRRPTIPFDVDWGDGSHSTGFFPLSHSYPSKGKAFAIRMISHYADGSSTISRKLVSFVPPKPCKPNAAFPVSVPDRVPAFKTVLYAPNPNWIPFRSNAKSGVTRRTIESVLSAATGVISGYFEGDHQGSVDGTFPQVLVMDSKMEGGGYSVWFTRPVAFALGNKADMAIYWSSAFHEIGHNVSLNAPRSCRIGGRFDGSGNTMLAESLAQILQHATGKHLVDHASEYGLDPVLAGQIESSCKNSMMFLARCGREYMANGCRFETWNKPETPEDESMPTFMFLAYRFLVGIEEHHRDWDRSVTRFMRVIRCIDEDLAKRLDNRTPTEAAGVANSTLMVAAASYGLDLDMCPVFRQAKFPVDDALYAEIMRRVRAGRARGGPTARPSSVGLTNRPEPPPPAFPSP